MENNLVTPDKHKQLSFAVNSLCEFIEFFLPYSYEIRLSCSGGESCLELLGKDGEEIHVDGEYGRSIVIDMVNTARKIEGMSII